MSTPAPVLSVSAVADQPSYAPGATVTIDATALQQIQDTVAVSVTLADVVANTSLTLDIEEPAAGATFGITDSLGTQWSIQPGAAPGTAVLTGVIPAAAAS